MKFEESKSAYLTIERGKQKYTTEILEINGTKIQPIKEDMTYKCLGVDENVSYNGSLNKDRIRSEYFKRIRKIWKVLNMTCNFHRNSDVHRLYASRKEGGRSLKMVTEAYKSRII